MTASVDEINLGFRTTYLDYERLTAQLRAWAEAFPGFVRLQSLDRTREGRDLWLLTIGAVLWFLFIQPLLEATFTPDGHLVVLAIQLLGVAYLLKHVTFLIIWFVGLWLVLKWDTQRRVDRLLSRWKSTSRLDPDLSLAAQVVEAAPRP